MNKLTRYQKIGYGMGDLASNLVFQLSVIFLLFFYTDVLGISPMAAGLIFLLARVWDAINDPIMGLLMDHTKSKHGKARVYLRYGSLPLAILTVLMFLTPDLSPTMKIVYASVTYILWGMCYTLVNIPYSSLTSMMTNDPEERTSLSSIRMIFMLIGVLMVSIIAEPMVGAFETPQMGYMMVAIVFAGLSFVFFQWCFYATAKTGNVQEKQESYKLKEVYPLLFKNKQLLIVTMASLLGNMAVFMRETSAIYFVTYNMGDKSLLPVFLGLVVLAMVIGNLLIPSITRKFDKKGTYMIGSFLAIAGSVLIHFIPASNTVLVLAIASISSMGFAAISTIGWSMVPDTVEYGEYKTGVRTEGIIYSVYSFSQKLATALSGVLVAFVLDYSGYVANAPTQGEGTLLGILSTLSILPTIFVVLSVVTIYFYTIDKDTFSKIQQAISEKKAV